MFIYKRLNSKGNAKNAFREILANGVNKVDLRFVVYNLAKNHIECASEGPDAVAHYQLGESIAKQMLNDSTNGFEHAVLAYNLRSDTVYLLDSVPELSVANCLLLCVMNILIDVDDTQHETCGEVLPNIDNVVTAQRRPPTRVIRDGAIERFMPFEGAPTLEDDLIGGGFRLGSLGQR